MRSEESLPPPDSVVYDSVSGFPGGTAVVGPITPTTADS